MDELILQIDVRCHSAVDVDGHTKKIVMLAFDGDAGGRYFTGKVIGTGVDTQTYPKDENGAYIEGKLSLSARYMLEGRDYTGKFCRIFIENNVNGSGWIPSIVTDSDVLAEWESAKLRSTVEPVEEVGGGVTVKIYKCDLVQNR